MIEASGGFRHFQVLVPNGTPPTMIYLEATGSWLRNGDELTFASISAVAEHSFTARLSGATELHRTRLEKAGQRRRRYYRITADGKDVLASQRRSWKEFFAAINRVAGVQHA